MNIKKNNALDWLRCGALALIIYDHLVGFRMPEWTPVVWMDHIFMKPLELIQYGGALVVSIFFVISGYLLALGVDSGKYTLNKLPKKILQLYIPMIMSYCSFYLLQKGLSAIKYEHYFSQFTNKDWLMGGSLIGYFTERGDVINGTTWYLVPTFIAYGVVFAFSRLLKKSFMQGFISMELTLGITMIFGRWNGSFLFYKLFSYNWYIFILLFGIIIYYFDQNKLTLKQFGVVAILNYICLILGIYLYMPAYVLEENYVVSVAYAILLLFVALNINLKYNLKEIKCIRSLSDISYYIYLVHMPYGSLLLSMLEGHVYLPVAICVVLVSILVIAIFHKKICSRVLCIY